MLPYPKINILSSSMSKIKVLYEGDLHTIATHEDTGQTLHTDAPKDNQGQGQTFSPTDLLATSLATCIATIMGIYARNHNIDLRGMRIEIEKVMSTDTPRRIVKLLIGITFPEGVSEKEKAILTKVGQGCPVHHSLHPNIEFAIKTN
jgi:uncharacterized OsmC-like protein